METTKKRVLSLSAAALVAIAGFATEVVNSEDIYLESALTVEVASGDVYTYSGVVSGEGSLTKKGPGKLVLSGANTFSGGVTLQEGFLEVAEEDALGTGTLTLKNPNSDPDISSKFSKKDAVVTNNIKLPNTSSNASNSDPHIHVLENTTFSGNITSYANTFYMGNRDCGQNSIATAYPTNTIAGSLWIYGTRNLTLGAYGVTILKGPVTAGGITIGTYFSSEGSLVLDTDSCNVGAFNLSSGSLYCKRQNVLNGAQLRIRQKNASSASHIDLGGFDQTCSIFGEYSSGSTFPVSGTGYSINSPEGPATLTVTGGAANASCTCHFAISDRITLLLDAEPTFTCKFTTRANGTSGDIVVSNGVFSVVNTATFKAVPRIVVAEHGKFVLSSTETEALAGVTELEVAGEFRSTASAPFTSGAVHLVIAEGAVFDLGGTLNSASLVIRGTDLDAGVYTHAEFSEIAEGTSIVVPVQKRTATWVGGGV
ncbi:MAG: autotransporter-associated beta strand repeat-containing protein, partial [Kiritimatiellae bacterium]|nr:autotransporter-associated beta strand repeat-containing protein [Kiritimatiellia bacterium]